MRSLKCLLAIVLLSAAPRLYAGPCLPTTLDAYLAPGFACTVSDEQWRFSDFRFQGAGTVASARAQDVFVTPFGGTQVAGLRFDIREPFNAIRSGDGFRAIDLAYDVLSTAGIVNAALETINAFAGPPDGDVFASEFLCLNGFYDGLTFECSSGTEESLWGPGLDTQAIPRTVFVGVRSQWIIKSGDELPGGARLDGVIHRFRTIPEPPGILLVIAGMLGLAAARVRRMG